MPTFLLLLLLALQPVCLLYTRAVMEGAAAETARIMITGEGDDEDAWRSFALRRLAAVPNISIFHAGGELDWEIELGTAAVSGGTATVSITGEVAPLPVLGVFASALGTVNSEGNVELSVTVSYEGRPSWLEGSYESWIEVWE